MKYRWEFVATLSGWGETIDEAWEQLEESIAQDGFGSPPVIVNAYKPKEIEQAARLGSGYAMQCEPMDSSPEGTMQVWDDRLLTRAKHIGKRNRH